jgi:hypothetical protein
VTVVVCRKCKHSDCLTEMLHERSHEPVQLARCQKICHGPVVGVMVDGRMEWFERVDRVRQLAALLRLVKQEHPTKIPKQLKQLRVKRRSGRAVR